ncbi:MAG: gamma-glutamyl-gamma-aminobutyrate hydrolase family protein [Actinomycetota bacterium]
MTAPLIAIVAYRLDAGRVTRWSTGAYAVHDLYVEAVRRAGGVAALLPAPFVGPAEQVMARFDGLMLIGGGDVDPSRYGAERHPEVYSVDPDRDESETALIRRAADVEIPTLAICRGAQVMNTAFGGTLIQHLPDDPGMAAHRAPDGETELLHSVRIANDSLLAKIVGGTAIEAASRHHQGIAEVGKGLRPLAWSDDGLVEAIQLDGRWMVGVQWHPEVTAERDRTQQALFDALVARASARGRIADPASA